MKTHSTNYFDTFIEVAEDTKAKQGTIPPVKDNKTVAEMQYELISQNPYKYTSDDIIFIVFATRNDISNADQKQAREQFFSKEHPCLRTSPLTKTYGFGIHCDSKGNIALYGMDTDEYKHFLNDPKIKKIKAMRTTKK